jgi:hypothetical protein
VNAENEAGGTATASVTYRVIYRFDYIGPILEHPATNFANAGQRIKVRFTMYGEFGKNVIKGWPRHRRVDCGTGAPLSRLTTGRIKTFRYVSSVNQYMLAWNTNSAWDGTCRDFVVRLRDGTQRTAHFNFATP